MSVDWTKYPPLPEPRAFSERRPDSKRMNALAAMIMTARPDFGEVDSETMKASGAIMAARPDFDEAEFRKYWPSSELADMALEIRSKVRKNWALPDKMLYPNDPLKLFYAYKRTGSMDNYEDFFMDIGLVPAMHLWPVLYDWDSAFAELAEITLAKKKEMAVDWTRYPPLPEPPAFPEWRDTPEREAYFEELQNFDYSYTTRYLHTAALLAVTTGAFILGRSKSVDCGWGTWLCTIGSMVLIAWLIGLIAAWILMRIRLWKKYGFFLLKLRRPNLSKAVAAIMADRPDFDEAEFRKYWPSSELADMALEIRSQVRENWALPRKMLYPNDSLMLLYGHKMTGDDEDYEDFFIDLGFIPLYSIYDYDKTFAELTEKALKFRRESEEEERKRKEKKKS